MIDRRRFLAATPALLGGASLLAGCGADSAIYDTAANRTWRLGAVHGLDGAAVRAELVRYATLAPSSHNTQCWRFALEEAAIAILPDFTRRCPAVDPDDHHLFVSLGCAAENLIQAAGAFGLHAEARFDVARDALRIALAPATASARAPLDAIVARQSTRAEYDGRGLTSADLAVLERAGTSAHVHMRLLTERNALERVLAYVVEANTAQMNDPAFVAELKAWIRFSARDAVRRGDGLFAASSGNPALPARLGSLMFDLMFTAGAENEKYARQLRSSAGVAVFIGRAADKAHWVEVGRAYERFALAATGLGIRNAFVNQPVEVAALRPQFANAFGLGGHRPDLVVRFGRGPLLPRALRRPLDAVLV